MPSPRARPRDFDLAIGLMCVGMALTQLGVPKGFALTVVGILVGLMGSYWPWGERSGGLFWIAVLGVSAVALMLFLAP